MFKILTSYIHTVIQHDSKPAKTKFVLSYIKKNSVLLYVLDNVSYCHTLLFSWGISPDLYIHINMYVCICMFLYIHICIYRYICTFMYIYIYLYIHMYTHKRLVYICKYTQDYIWYIHIHIYVCRHIYICIYVCIYT